MEKKEDKIIFDKIYSNALHQMMLYDFVQNIGSKKSIGTGSEGNAYLLGEDYVVKSFYRASHGFEDDKEVFVKYIKEMQKYKKEGLNFPEYYAWIINNNPKYTGKFDDQAYNYYLLEERIKGTQFCPEYIEQSYSLFEDFCSEKDFNDFLKTPNQNINLMKEIIKTYINHFIKINEIFESMPESKIEKMMLDTFNIYLTGMYSEPDLFGSNVFFTNDDKDITLIDTRVVNKRGIYLEDGYNTPRAFLEVFRLFEKDDIPFETIKEYDYESLDPAGAIEIYKLIEKNKEVCKSALRKIIKIMKKIEFERKFIDNETFEYLYKIFTDIFSKEESDKLFDEVQRNL